MKIIFFGSSNYCIPILESINNNFNLVTIITKKGQSVEKFAQSHNIKAYTPVNKEELINLKNDISSLKPDLAIVADYGLLIPKEIFSIPHYQTLNIHFSKLPKLRGPSPVQYTILLGEKSAWISIIIMGEGMDTGDIIWQKEFPLTGTETTESLYKTLFETAAKELPTIINNYANHKLIHIRQNHSKANYTKRLTREDGFVPPDIIKSLILSPDVMTKLKIPLEVLKEKGILRLASQDDLSNLSHLSIFIERACRALSPWPGLWTYVSIAKSGKALKTPRGWQAERSEAMPVPSEVEGTLPIVKKPEENKRLKILKVHLAIDLATTSNLPLKYGYSHTDVEETKAKSSIKFAIDQVQLEGKKPVSWQQFREGYPQLILS